LIGLVRSLVRRIRLYLLQRRQFDSLPLRAHFQKRYNVEVGLYSYGCFDPWRMSGPMRVGRYCSIARSTRAARANHPMQALPTHPALYEKSFGVIDADVELNQLLVIEDDVWIGHNTMVLPGCKRIGRGAIIGAGSVVTHDVEPYAIVAGNPAHKLRDRFPPDLAAAIDASRWWELDLADLRRMVSERPQMVYNPTPELLSAWSRQ